MKNILKQSESNRKLKKGVVAYYFKQSTIEALCEQQIKKQTGISVKTKWICDDTDKSEYAGNIDNFNSRFLSFSVILELDGLNESETKKLEQLYAGDIHTETYGYELLKDTFKTNTFNRIFIYGMGLGINDNTLIPILYTEEEHVNIK